MPFKIVQTVENGVRKLTIVPTMWEAKGIVRWPPKNIKYPSKLVKDENSSPGPAWDSFKCVLKRNNIPTYEKANEELDEMEQNTDTDYDIDSNSIILRTSTPGLPINEDIINFEAMAQDLCNSQPADNVSCTSTTNVFCQQQDTIQVYNTEEIQTVIANQALMLEKLNILVENQKKIALKVASLSVQLEETKVSISQEKERPVNVTLLQDQLGTEENESFYVTPIENQQQLEMLETNLADKIKKKKFFKTLSLLCSSTVGNGTACAYKLLDVLFSRDFLCQCSWSGGSKGEFSKIAFKNYKNFRMFFFEMVNSWDSNFTDDDAVKFLKLVLRNATKRKAMKGLRQSSKRTRQVRNRGNYLNRGEQFQDNVNCDRNHSEKSQTGDESKFDNNREEPQAGENREQPKAGDNNESSDEAEMDLC